jgi:hypothetical protein
MFGILKIAYKLLVNFRFERPKDLSLFPGHLVDVYIGKQTSAATTQASP